MRPQLPARSTTPLSMRRRTSLRELALLYLKLGATAMGGPAAHIAMMEEEVVDRRRWLTRDEFLDFLGAANVIPGPSSTEMAIHVGRVRAGWPGLVVAGISFILPASLMVGSLAWAYVRFGALPRIAASLYGVKPVVIVVIAQGAIRLARSAIKSTGLAVLAAMSVLAAALGLDALFTLFAAGVVAGCVHLARTLRHRPSTVLAAVAVSAAGVAVPFRLGLMSLVFLKIGATLFGGGYVLVAFLRSDFVARLHWLTEQQLLDAVAVGQGYARALIHHRNLHRLCSGRPGGGGTGHDCDISACLRVRRLERAPGRVAQALRSPRGGLGRNQRRGDCAHDRCVGATGPDGRR